MEVEIFFGSSRERREKLSSRVNPYTNEVVSRYPICDENDAQKALNIAKNAKKSAKNAPLSRRISWLLDVASKLESSKEEFAKYITDEVAKPITFALAEIERGVETIRATTLYANSLSGELYDSNMMPSGKDTISYYKREPVGVVVAIAPFNFPINLVLHKIAPALLAGNTIVLKPTPEAPMCAYKLVELFVDSPYATKDAISLVYGDALVGSTLVRSEIPRVISFTGSVGVGEIIAKSAGIKKLALELGGNAATLVTKSADLEFAAKRCAFGAFVNSGQVCISLQRIYVESEVYDTFSKLLVDETKKLKVGSPYDKDTFLSSLINIDAQNRALSWLKSAKDSGANILCGGEIENSLFLPTVVGDVDESMKIACEEVFAPIVSLFCFDDLSSAISCANSSPYGLQFSIFTNELSVAKRAIDEFECGGVVINDIPTLRFDIQPYGGIKYSGIGREGAKFALEEFTEIKSVVIC